MKHGKSLQELAAEITRRSTAKKDFVVDTKNLNMHAQPVGHGVALQVGNDIELGVNAIAHQQIAEHTDIPKKYYDRMLSANSELLCANVNAWFGKDPTPRMVRTMDGKARAFLSDRYRPLENEELAEAVLPVLLDMDLDVMSAEITDRRLYIKAVNKTVTQELEAIGGTFGDGQHKIVRCLSPAITISNSEVGMGALSVLGGVYDGFCSNLATFGERSTRKYHVGGKHEIGNADIYALLSDSTRKKTNNAIFAQLADIVRGAFAEASFNALCDKIKATQADKIEGDLVKVIELTSKKLGLDKAEGSSILTQLAAGGDLTRFGLHNAITRAAQDVADYDRATEMERMGGVILELPRTEWHALAKAA